MFILLHNKSGQEIFINPYEILVMKEDDEGTDILLKGNEYIEFVIEKPIDIINKISEMERGETT